MEEVEAHLQAAAFAGRVRLAPDQIPDCATAYWGSRDAVNWTRNGIPAVSYTHLDVYKRQEQLSDTTTGKRYRKTGSFNANL